MLLLCGYKDRNTNEELKQKLFQNKGFVKNFLGIEIYKHKKISKLYGLIIIHIYKQNPTLDIKKSLVSSIILNLKHVEHSKTELNLAMILNELKFVYKLKMTQVREQNLFDRISNIYKENKETFQSVHALNYLLHLGYEFPELSRKSVSEYKE